MTIEQKAVAQLTKLQAATEAMFHQFQKQYVAINTLRDLLELPLVDCGPDGKPVEIPIPVVEPTP